MPIATYLVSFSAVCVSLFTRACLDQSWYCRGLVRQGWKGGGGGCYSFYTSFSYVHYL